MRWAEPSASIRALYVTWLPELQILVTNYLLDIFTWALNQISNVPSPRFDFPPNSASPHHNKCQFHFFSSCLKNKHTDWQTKMWSRPQFLFLRIYTQSTRKCCWLYLWNRSGIQLCPFFSSTTSPAGHHLSDLDFHNRFLIGPPALSGAFLYSMNTTAAKVTLLKPKSHQITVLLKAFHHFPLPSWQGPT